MKTEQQTQETPPMTATDRELLRDLDFAMLANMIENLRNGDDAYYTPEAIDAAIESLRAADNAAAQGVVLTNPHNGEPRDYRDVNSDPEGKLIVAPGEPLRPATQPGGGVTDALWATLQEAVEWASPMEDAPQESRPAWFDKARFALLGRAPPQAFVNMPPLFPGLPKAFGNCRCSCHRTPGVKHFIACCSPDEAALAAQPVGVAGRKPLTDAALIAGWEAKADCLDSEENDDPLGHVAKTLRDCAQELRSRIELGLAPSQPAPPAVPEGDSASLKQIVPKERRASIDDNGLPHSIEDEAYTEGWNACRQAMLTASQPQSGAVSHGETGGGS